MRALQERYERFAREEARGNSPRYEEFAYTVAQNTDLCEFLLSLPVAKQQPNLLFGAFRACCGDVTSGAEFRELLLANKEEVRAIMLSRSTQTNEPARCATLLPVLASLVQPLSLIEVGASAGLCLYPDCYVYVYGDHHLDPDQTIVEPPRFVCSTSNNTPLPTALPEVVWRSGIDINPLSVANESDMAWLENLVWPEQTTRQENLRLAIDVARREPPNLMRGDLLSSLEAAVRHAPDNSTVVVFHTAVLAYVTDRAERARFVDAVTSLDVTWISNEHPAVFPEIAARAPIAPPKDQFLLAVDGLPVAYTGPHGQSIEWFST